MLKPITIFRKLPNENLYLFNQKTSPEKVILELKGFIAFSSVQLTAIQKAEFEHGFFFFLHQILLKFYLTVKWHY